MSVTLSTNQDNPGKTEGILNQMAEAGGRAQSGQPTKFYPVTNKEDFAATLKRISGEAVPCTYAFGQRPDAENLIGVSFDGVEIARDSANGWSTPDDYTTIEFNGEACEWLRFGKDDVDVDMIDVELLCSNEPD